MLCMRWNAGYCKELGNAHGTFGSSTPYAAGAARWNGCAWVWVVQRNGVSAKSPLSAEQPNARHEKLQGG